MFTNAAIITFYASLQGQVHLARLAERGKLFYPCSYCGLGQEFDRHGSCVGCGSKNK